MQRARELCAFSRIEPRRIIVVFAVLFVCITLPARSATAESSKEKKVKIENGSQVSLEYTLSHDGDKLESNVGGEPLKYTHGQRMIVPGLEKELDGLSAGDKKQVTVTPEEAYGPIRDEAYLEVPKAQIPEEAQKIGAQLMTKDQQGNVLRPRVKEIKDETVVLDFNHPLAGKELTFDVEVKNVEEAAAAPAAAEKPAADSE